MNNSKLTRKRFVGALAKPIIIPPLSKINAPTILNHPDGVDGVIRWWKEYSQKTFDFILIERLKKFAILCQAYNIEIGTVLNGNVELAWKLAVDFVPGFSVKHSVQQGRRSIWSPEVLLRLWWHIRKIEQAKGCSARRACNILTTKEPWETLLTGKKDALSHLYKRYQEAKDNEFYEPFKKELRKVHTVEMEQLMTRLVEAMCEPWHNPMELNFKALICTVNSES